MLPGMGLLGAGSCTIFSQRRQDFFKPRDLQDLELSRDQVEHLADILAHKTQVAPPQSGQQVPGSSSRRSRGVASDTRGRRRGLCSAVSLLASCRRIICGGSGTFQRLRSAGLPAPVRAVRSRARPSPRIWPKACFFSFAMRNRRVWISWSLSPDCRRHPRILRLQGSDHRLQKAQVFGQDGGITRHASNYHRGSRNTDKNKPFQIDKLPPRAPVARPHIRPAPVNSFPQHRQLRRGETRGPGSRIRPGESARAGAPCNRGRTPCPSQ